MPTLGWPGVDSRWTVGTSRLGQRVCNSLDKETNLETLEIVWVVLLSSYGTCLEQKSNTGCVRKEIGILNWKERTMWFRSTYHLRHLQMEGNSKNYFAEIPILLSYIILFTKMNHLTPSVTYIIILHERNWWRLQNYNTSLHSRSRSNIYSSKHNPH